MGFNVSPSTVGRTSNDLPRSFAEAAQRLSAWRANPRRRRSACKIAHNTFLVYHSDGPERYAVRLHETDVVTFYADGGVKLTTDGWQTFTTRDRMNRCGASVGMAGGVASVSHGARSWTYADNMVLYPDGNVRYLGFANPDAEAVRKLRRRRLAAVKRVEKRTESRWDRMTDSDRVVILNAWYWPNRSGGQAHGGNAPEAFEAAS